MQSQLQLQHRLQIITNKLKNVYKEYEKIKDKLRVKDEEILRLKIYIGKLEENQEIKENNKVEEIRKKYEMEATFRSSYNDRNSVPRPTQPI